MPKGKITYGVEFTRNLGNFENVKPRYEVEIDVDFIDLEDLNKLRKPLEEQVDEWLVNKVQELEAELKE